MREIEPVDWGAAKQTYKQNASVGDLAWLYGNSYLCGLGREEKRNRVLEKGQPRCKSSLPSHKRPPLPILVEGSRAQRDVDQSTATASTIADISSREQATCTDVDAALASNSNCALSEVTPPPGLPSKWEWPPWCLNHKMPCIEVYVADHGTGSSRWCKAEPRVRVVDDHHQDAYLCAEYMWRGEIYVQDFGPHQVRRRGQRISVFQMYEQSAHGAMDERLTRAHPFNGLPSYENVESDPEDEKIGVRFKRWQSRTSLLTARLIVGKLKNMKTTASLHQVR